MPCNFNHRQLAEWVKEGIREAGGTPVEFNTIAVSDGVAMGTEGMKASLISREIVADSIELVTRGHLLDALVCISGCDKTIPGTVMALARMDIPGLMANGGSTTAVLHLLAVAREANVSLTLDDFDKISSRTPLLADMKPWGKYTAVDMDKAGGILLVMKRLLEAKVLDGNAMTVSGKTIGEEAAATVATKGQTVVKPLND